jgi:dTDP-4-amino-4,6-dideoxygalactose transaminase
MKSNFLPYAKQSISSVDLQEMSSALAGDLITRGVQVDLFERAIAEYCGAKYAVAFNSGTSALFAACHAIDLTPYDRVLTTPNTFVASVTAGMRKKAIPVFVDIDRDTGNMDLDQLELNLQTPQRTRGRTLILPVHFAGIPVDMQRIDRMIRSPDTVVIEDGAHALGSCYPDGQKVGCCAWSQMTILSFHPAKTITTGEGGMVTTNDPDLYLRLKSYRNNGIEKDPARLKAAPSECFDGYYEVNEISGNFNFTEFQAALGHSQLRRIDQFIAKRRQLMSLYRDLLRKLPNVKLFTAAFDPNVAYHICVAQIDFGAYNTTRATVISQHKEKGIGTQVHYIPVYRHPFFRKKCGDISAYFPQTETYYAQALTLPLYYDLSLDSVEFVVKTLEEILQTELRKPKPKPPQHNGRQRRR